MSYTYLLLGAIVVLVALILVIGRELHDVDKHNIECRIRILDLEAENSELKKHQVQRDPKTGRIRAL